MGNLSSGSSRCNNINGYDFYGQFQSQWNDVQGSSKELESWLDPNGNSPSYNDGRDPCYNDLIIQNRLFYPAGNYQSSNSVTIQAGNTITASNVTIPSNSEYHFTAGTRIYLKSGFQVKNGSYFTASITPCSQIARKNGIDIRESLKNTTIQHDLDPVAVKEYLSIYPNPFNHKTMIEFSVQQKDNISILFYDIYGTKIYTLTENFTYENGIYQINFDSNLAQLSAGVYFCTIITSTYSQTKKIIITR